MIQKFRHIIARVKVLRLLQGMLSRRDVGASVGLAFCQLAWKQLSRGVDTATCSCAKLKPVWTMQFFASVPSFSLPLLNINVAMRFPKGLSVIN